MTPQATSKESSANVLGLCSTGHGAAVSLVSPNHGVRAMTLDRFTGHKHSLLFTRAEQHDILNKTNPVDKHIHSALAYSYQAMPKSYVVEEIFEPFFNALIRQLPLKPADINVVVTSNCHFAFNRSRIGSFLNDFFPKADICFELEHHQIHQWQAFLPSGFERAAVLTMDESGESLARLGGRKLAMTLSTASESRIDVHQEFCHPESSPGYLYADFCRHIGYHAGEEGKLMGLAPYGGQHIYQLLRPELDLFPNGAFRFMSSAQLCKRLATVHPRRMKGEPICPIHADIACAGQMLLEDVLINAVHALERMSDLNVKDVCFAGGVALNSSANEKIFRASRFSNVYIPPNPGDDGHALACALWGSRILRRQRWPRKVESDYLGPTYSDAEICTAIVARGIRPRKADAKTIARLLAHGRIVGMFDGGAEHGPRALGNRSILADPRKSETTNIVNERVKRRELYRPYAPVVLEEKAADWFDYSGPSPFMLRVVPVLPSRKRQVGAVTHIDGSARLQTLRRETNPMLYEIIQEFETLTGVPVLLNTSFNLAGKPIVETPKDAIDCFCRTGLGALVIGNYLLAKRRKRRFALKSVIDDVFRNFRERRRYAALKTHARKVSRRDILSRTATKNAA